MVTYLKEVTKTIVREFDDKGNVVKETETVVEKEYREMIPKWDYFPSIPSVPSSVPIYPWNSPPVIYYSDSTGGVQ